MTRRINKRDASYVPSFCREELHKLSKADLMEIAYDFAVRSVGEGAGALAAYDEIVCTARIIANACNRKAPRLHSGAELTKGPPLPSAHPHQRHQR